MVTKRWLLKYIIVIAIVLSSCCNPPSEAPCSIEGLLLTIEDLPPGKWEEAGSRSIKGAPMQIGVERIGTSFATNELFDGVLHDIYRFESSKSAYHAYSDKKEGIFSVRNYLNNWELPTELSHIHLTADQHKFECNVFESTGADECILWAQYKSYLVRFSFRQHDLKDSDVISMIETIDKKMAQCNGTK